jgi:hypothetical protein
VFFEHAPFPTTGFSAARREEIAGLLEIQIPLLTGKKNPAQAFFCEHPTPKHALIQVFADEFATLTVELTAEFNSGITAELTAE